ncbi:MAG: type II secretion system F family protein [Lachnospiraceae bacterium]|nr:type II secretion system F family protein [Lachnospiraceae bacterium]
MTSDDFDFQPLAEQDRDILSMDDFMTQDQRTPESASARADKKDGETEKRRSKRRSAEKKEDDSADLEYIEADIPAKSKARDEEQKPHKKVIVKKKNGKETTHKPKKRREKDEEDYVPYSEAPTGDWDGFESIAPDEPTEKKKPRKKERKRDADADIDIDEDKMQYPAPDGSRIVDAYTVVEKAEYEKVDISPDEARGRISYEALRDMCNEFSRIQSAGVSIRGALRIVKEQTEDEQLKEELDRVYERVKMGDDLSEAMNKCDCFPFAFTIAVSAAEKNDMIAMLFGKFGEIFAAEVKDKEHRKVSVLYPFITTGCAMVIMLILCLAVFPAFMDMFSKLGLEGSGATAVVFSAAMTVKRIWWLLLILVILIFAGSILFKVARENNLFGARRKEKNIRENSYERMTVYVKFVRYMNALLKVGVATKDALFVTAHSFYDYPFMTDMLLEAANAAAAGSTLSNALCVSDFFPMMILQMISVGEEMGDTPEMLQYIAEYYEAEAHKKEAEEHAAKGTVTIIVMAVSVLLLLLMMLLPMLSLFKAVSGM